jgi:hypothetical protein
MSREKIKIRKADRGWDPVLKSGTLDGLAHEGNWSVSGLSALCVDATEGGGAWLALAEKASDFELRAGMEAPTGGGNASVFFRQQDGGNYYQFDLKCDLQVLMISKVVQGRPPRVLSAVNYELQPGREVRLELAARGDSLTSYVDGKLQNQAQDADFASGAVLLTAWKARTRYADLCLRLY